MTARPLLPGADSKRVAGRRGRARLGAVLTALSLPVIVPTFGCGEDLEAAPPRQLIGTWVTDHPRYWDRGFEISEDAIVFYTGSGIADFTAHPILATLVEDRGSATIYRFQYRGSDGSSLTFSLRLDPDEEGIVRLPNQPLITWRRGERTGN